MHARTEMLDVVVVDGRARGIVTRDMVTGEIRSWAADAVVLATGGYANAFFLSTNAKGCNATAAWRAHRRGAYFANPCFTQIHPTCIPQHGDYQSKLTLMSESLRNDGRIWVPKEKGDQRAANEIPEGDRDYYLERRYPAFGNLVPRDIASRAAKAICDEGKGIGATRRGVYLDFAEAIGRLGKGAIESKYGNLFEMYERITDEDPYQVPMRIYPAPHYTMGGIWVDYNLMTTVPGLYAIGEANFSDHGANRLGASALMQGLADGYFVLPNTINDHLARYMGEERMGTDHAGFQKVEGEVEARMQRLLAIQGKRTVDSLHRELGTILEEQCGMARNRQGLEKAIGSIAELREEYWQNVLVPGAAQDLNQSLEKAGRVGDYFELAELMCRDALDREESCGTHFREEYQTPEGEALRNDDDYTYVAAWEFQGAGAEPVADEAEVAECRRRLPGLPNARQGRPEGLARGRPIPRQHRQLQQRRVVPVVGLARGDPALDRVAHDRQEHLSFRRRWLSNLHQRDRVDARIGVAPVRLETFAVDVDRLVEVPFGQECLAGLNRRLPAILVHPPENAEGLAAWATTLDQLQQNPLRLVTTTGAVEGEPELLTNHHRAGERLRHRLRQPHHLVPRTDRAIGEKQVDDDARFRVPERGQLLLDGAHGVGSLRPRQGEALLLGQGVADPVTEDVGLGVIDVRVVLDHLVEGAVDGPLPRRPELGCQGCAVVPGVGGHTTRIEPIGQRSQQADVEGQLAGALREHQGGGVRSGRVTHPELVEDVGIGRGQIGDRIFAEQQALEHRLVDDAAGLLLVGADRLKTRGLDRRSDQPFVDGIEIDRAAETVRLLPERHQHEAEWLVHDRLLMVVEPAGARFQPGVQASSRDDPRSRAGAWRRAPMVIVSGASPPHRPARTAARTSSRRR